MTLPAYPKYKPSGVEWLGDVPHEWEVRRLKFDILKAGSGVTPKGGANVYQSSGIPLLRSQNIHFDGLRLDDVAYIAEDVHESMGNSKVLAGDVLLNITGASIGRCYFFDGSLEEANVNQHVCIIRPEPSLLTHYLHYFLWSNVGQFQIQLEQSGSGREGLNFAVLKNFIVPMMNEAEQQRIIDYLDQKTGQIDELIGKKKELIGKLKEQRTALITHAVTKGLDDSAPMKDSGVEWLGQVPEHWDVAVLKRYWDVVDCKHLTAEFVDEGIPLASIREVQSWTIDLSKAKQTTEDYYNLLIEGGRKPKAGDIIYSRNATVGEASLVTAILPKFALGQDVCILKPNGECASEFYLYMLKSLVIKSQLDELMVGATFKRINVENIRNFCALHPPADEQKGIVDYLDKKTGQIDGLIGKATAVIQRLEEYRTAVITAAVTGKIKVDDASSFVANER